MKEEDARRLARALLNGKDDTRFAIETFLAAVEGNHPAKLVLVADRKGAVEGEVTSGPAVG